MDYKLLQGAKKNVLLKNYTTYKIGGLAKYFFVAKNKDDLIKAIKTAKELKIPFFILGGGSNVLFSDKGFKGLVIKIQTDNLLIKDGKIIAGAGLMLSKLVDFALENNFTGLEWSRGVPGTVGGAVFGNAQAFGTKISDQIESVEALDLKTLTVKNFSKKHCKFSLKNSVFKKTKKLIITSIVFKLEKSEKNEIQKKTDDFLNYRKNNHPNFPSAGSTFVNPEKKIKNKKLLAKFPELNVFNERGTIPAGYLIQKSGLQGKKIGGAQISEKHANFIVNNGGAKAKDVLALIKLAQKKVKENFNINLETEIQII